MQIALALIDGAGILLRNSDGAAPYVAVWGEGEAMTPKRAREVARALEMSADVVEEETLIASGRPTIAEVKRMNISEIEGYAASRGVPASTVLRVVEREG